MSKWIAQFPRGLAGAKGRNRIAGNGCGADYRFIGPTPLTTPLRDIAGLRGERIAKFPRGLAW